MGTEPTPRELCPETLTVPTRTPGSALAVVLLGGFGAVACGVMLAVAANVNLGGFAVRIVGVYLALCLWGLAVAARDVLASYGGTLTLSPEAVAFSCRLYEVVLPPEQVVTVRWRHLNRDVRLTGSAGRLTVRMDYFPHAERDRIVTWLRQRWPDGIHRGWERWAKHAALAERLPNRPILGRDRLAPPDQAESAEPPPTPPTVRLDVRARPRAWIGSASCAGLFLVMVVNVLTLPFVAAPPRGAGDPIVQLALIALLAAFPVGMFLFCLRLALTQKNGRLVLDPDWVIYSCAAFTRRLAVADVTAVEWRPVFRQVRLRGADGTRITIDLDYFPRAKRWAVLTWVRGRFPDGLHRNWDEFPARRFLPPPKDELKSLDVALPFLFGRGLLKLLLLVVMVSAVVGEVFGYVVMQQMPPGRPFVIDVPILGNRQIALASPEDWAVLSAAVGGGVGVLFLGGMRVMLAFAVWVSDDGDGSS
jgi:hypothetical protein